ncbi:MAG: hypothetical protein QME66_02900 [Candidatus Eisenbacteria bacterium]|nr:hypothetical protein [Candidatus Eisenbacteria bacterium]
MSGRRYFCSFCLVIALTGFLALFAGKFDSTEPGNIRHLSFVRVCEAQTTPNACTGDPDDLLSWWGKVDSLQGRNATDPAARTTGTTGIQASNSVSSLSLQALLKRAAEIFLLLTGRNPDWLWLIIK